MIEYLTVSDLREKNRQLARRTVLDAAQRLLQKGDSNGFRMRDLAGAARVAFTTPFNHFGSKEGVMKALLLQLIEEMVKSFKNAPVGGDVIDRVFSMTEIAVDFLLKAPRAYKVIVGSLSVPTPASVKKNVQFSSAKKDVQLLWDVVLGDMKGIAADQRDKGRVVLAEQLTIVFCGCLSLWSAGDILDDRLRYAIEGIVSAVLLDFVGERHRERLRWKETPRPATPISNSGLKIIE
jgi:AcrR family transcriptional regulator